MAPASGRATDRGWLQQGLIRSSMLGTTYLAGDAELGKKDDDHLQRAGGGRRMGWSSGGGFRWRWRRRRNLLLLVVVVAAVVVLGGGLVGLGGIVAHVERRPGVEEGLRALSMGVGSVYEKPTSAKPTPDKSTHKKGREKEKDGGDEKAVHDGHRADDEPTGPPPGIQTPRNGEATPRTYSGPIRFFRLARSLRPAASRTAGYNERNRNVLFVMSSLQSVATLLPMICDMSKWNRNYVHAALMGRLDIALDDVLAINGIDKDECGAVWHDARPNYMEYSDDDRAERSVAAAMTHIHSFLHPQVAIMDDVSSENSPFVKAIRAKTALLKMPLIELPKDGLDDVGYVSRLDSSSLKHWHTPTVDIVVQVPPDSSNVLGLLKSIKEADYSGLAHPRITLDLPANLDVSVKQHIEKFTWPPRTDKTDSPTSADGLVVRRRITDLDATQEDAAMRFLELFYPTTRDSHVLLLYPQAQLSPHYFHYVKYALLEHQYSTFGKDDNKALMGISLDLPATLLDGKTPLTPPQLGDMHTGRYAEDYPGTTSVPFLWQAPTAAATLLWADKWAEWHDFVGNRVRKNKQQSGTTARANKQKEVSPAWTEYMEEFMQARGYTMLYPAKMDKAFVAVHDELNQLSRGSRPRASPRREPRTIPASMALLDALPFSGDLPELQYLPWLLSNGTLTSHGAAADAANEYANAFRRLEGGCEDREGMRRRVVPGETRDLFCFGDEGVGEWVGEDGRVEKLRAELEMAELEGLLGGEREGGKE